MAGIFKAYDIRGIYGGDLTEREVYLIAYYLVKSKGFSEFKVAHDMRLSYETLTKFFMKGLIDAGCKPVYLGMLATPNFYFSLTEGCNSGVIITASHNPKEYNGLKFMVNFKSFDSRNGLYELGDLVAEDNENIKGKFHEFEEELKDMSLDDFIKSNDVVCENFLDKYVNYLVDYYHKIFSVDDMFRLQQLKFGVDFSSGVSSLALVPFFEKVGLNVKLLNEVPDGTFPVHEPNPLKVESYITGLPDFDVDVTFVFDGDGDRLCFYDENGKFVLSDYPIAACINYFLKYGNRFVFDVRASKVLKDVCDEHNSYGRLIRVGRSFYQDVMSDGGCVFGAEISGHFFFRDFFNLDNADFALICVLKIILEEWNDGSEFKFSSLVDKYKRYIKLEETNIKVKDADSVLEKLKEKYSDYLTLEIDGYSFDVGNFWFNVRKSNTEPIIRINFEGKEADTVNKEMDNLVEFIKSV